MSARTLVCLHGLSAFLIGGASAATEPAFRSHPPMRPLPAVATRPLPDGPVYVVDAARGDDGAAGTAPAPWRTLARALRGRQPGDTVSLRGGVYYEHVRLTAAGQEGRPVTLRSHPGELAVIDGGFREFAENPADAWEPDPAGAPGEFRSTRAYPELGTGGGVKVLGNFADSLVPLHGYRFLNDLRAPHGYWQVAGKSDAESGVYCGPGVFHDAGDQRIRIRLAHTALDGWGGKNYTGEQDPRKLPLVIAGGPDSALSIVSSSWVRVQDIAVRGARGATLAIADSSDIELDGLSAYGGYTPVRVTGTARLRIVHAAFRGAAGPWSTRSTMKYRGLESQLFSAAGWSGNEKNESFEIAYSEFTDSCDGIFIGAVRDLDFHHNLLDNCSDDGFFVTANTGADGETWGGRIRIHQNVLARCLSTFAFGTGHGAQKELSPGIRQTGAGLHIFRNVIDLREPVHYGHPATPEQARNYAPAGRPCGDHGSPVWEPMWIYHNTVVIREDPFRNYYGGGFGGHLGQSNVARRVFNNIFIQLRGIPGVAFPPAYMNFAADGNLFWNPNEVPAYTNNFGAVVRRAARLAAQANPPPPPEKVTLPKVGDGGALDTLGPDLARATDGDSLDRLLAEPPPPPPVQPVPDWGLRDLFADPRFVRFSDDWRIANDYRPGPDSPALERGVAIPANWPDPLRTADSGAPDIGALPLGMETFRVGVRGRLSASAQP